MARKTFISYKYSEAQDLRNEILENLEMMQRIIKERQQIPLT